MQAIKRFTGLVEDAVEPAANQVAGHHMVSCWAELHCKFKLLVVAVQMILVLS